MKTASSRLAFVVAFGQAGDQLSHLVAGGHGEAEWSVDTVLVVVAYLVQGEATIGETGARPQPSRGRRGRATVSN